MILILLLLAGAYIYTRERFSVERHGTGRMETIDISPSSFVETPAGGILDGYYRLANMDMDPEDVGIKNEIWGPLYPLPEKPHYVTMSGLPYNFPPLSTDVVKDETRFSNR